MKSDIATCRSCHARIRWVTMQESGKKAPLDFEPTEAGNVYLNAAGRALVVSKKNVPPEEATFYTNHFATCPNAKKHSTTMTRQCPFKGCPLRIGSHLFACPRHWGSMPAALQQRVWDAYNSFKAGHITPAELRDLQAQILKEAGQ